MSFTFPLLLAVALRGAVQGRAVITGTAAAVGSL
eukprot:CAMPEP_0184361502 /NCGR_PEP_ID=MMETSP1089-20130417/130529_1 /TAXON_ID=38269 ORGANISM="Gloeochaete wittrockiana, Strain SAG46.84" /NCGR_SAMPLE_ID=MMETSP1089 /ASSEMBLY_ACC=CAM_ASM_000445 /LENGTH=33 /DNA_ID= /DNA_START= /DNA_END= /DNA_ORIENTATION=